MSLLNLYKLSQKKCYSFVARYTDAKNYKETDSSKKDELKRTTNPITNYFNDKKLKEKISELKSVYRLSIETRNFEITNLIHRNNFFMLFQGVLLAAVFSNQASKPYVEFSICLMGVFISWHQIKVAAGAKYWQEWWEVRTSDIENELKEKMYELTGRDDNFISLFDFEDKGRKEKYEKKVLDRTYKTGKKNKAPEVFENISKVLISGRYSVSRVPIASGIVLLITWMVLFLGTIGIADSVVLTSSKYELCYKKNDKCVVENESMLKDLWGDFKFINGHFFADNEDPPTQLIFNQYN